MEGPSDAGSLTTMKGSTRCEDAALSFRICPLTLRVRVTPDSTATAYVGILSTSCVLRWAPHKYIHREIMINSETHRVPYQLRG